MLKCPRCFHSLTPLTIKTNENGKIDIDHCYFCGGVWLDHFEINRIPGNLPQLKVKSLSDDEISKIKSQFLCPRDNSKLKSIRADSIPSNVEVLTCEKCSGNFLTSKALKRLKKAQKIKLNYFKTWNIPLPQLSAVMIPAIVLFAVTAGIFITVKYTKDQQEVRIKAKELIGEPTITVDADNSVLITFSTSIPVTSSISYRQITDKEEHIIPVSTAKASNHFILIRNLPSAKTYILKILIHDSDNQVITSNAYSFITH